jgi:hypothetical protein
VTWIQPRGGPTRWTSQLGSRSGRRPDPARNASAHLRPSPCPGGTGPVGAAGLCRHRGFFDDSCLIYAYASSEVLVELPKCAFVDHNIQGGGYMLDISEMMQLARERKAPRMSERYASNTFSVEPPQGGEPGSRLDVYIAWLNQSAWVYDAASQSWWRYVDNASPQTAGVLHTEIDRLTGRQLQFENVVVLFAQHDVISPTNLDIHLERGLTGKALLFRDGQDVRHRWSTKNDSPIQFQFEDGRPFPLKPGHTWVTIVTPLTAVTERRPGEWWLRSASRREQNNCLASLFPCCCFRSSSHRAQVDRRRRLNHLHRLQKKPLSRSLPPPPNLHHRLNSTPQPHAAPIEYGPDDFPRMSTR